MDLTTAQQVILVILSSFLAIFLLLGIVTSIVIIGIMRHIKKIINKAEHIADNAESVTNFFKQSAGPVALAKLISNLVHSYRESKNKS
ncbi:hypothetical protein KDA11_00025 [Candidatus Saccharibacteria bacterium]|nr:hypothetical protein [Candidatus Saccharibacteria bacterium]